MNKYKDVVYMILDELKIQSDDSIFTEDHIIYLINKVRPLLLENKYKKAQDISDSNYQTICLDLELVENKEYAVVLLLEVKIRFLLLWEQEVLT